MQVEYLCQQLKKKGDIEFNIKSVEVYVRVYRKERKWGNDVILLYSYEIE